MKKNPIVAIKVFKFGRAWRLVIEHKDGPDTVTAPKTFLAALEAAKTAWLGEQPFRRERREIPVSCQADNCRAIFCDTACAYYDERRAFEKWLVTKNAVRVGTSFVYEARR